MLYTSLFTCMTVTHPAMLVAMLVALHITTLLTSPLLHMLCCVLYVQLVINLVSITRVWRRIVPRQLTCMRRHVTSVAMLRAAFHLETST